MINQLDENGLKHGPWEFYSLDKNLMLRANYNRGALHGPYTIYRSDGSIKSECTYKNGKLNGLFYSYQHEEDGSTIEKGRWVNNNPSGLFYYSRYNK